MCIIPWNSLSRSLRSLCVLDRGSASDLHSFSSGFVFFAFSGSDSGEMGAQVLLVLSVLFSPLFPLVRPEHLELQC